MARNKRNVENSATIRFFKIITATSLETGNFRIPRSFTRKYGADMSNPMFLKPPDGNEWKVYHSKIDGDVWFRKGWKEFTKYYSLDHGYMVVFEYKGASHFEVHIFDKSTLEIEYPKHGNQDKQDNLAMIDDDSVETPLSKKTKRESPMSCPKPLKRMRTSTSENVGNHPESQNFPKEFQIEGNQSQGTNFEKSEFGPVNNKLEDDAGGTTESLRKELLTSKITSTDALTTAGTFRCDNPSFRAVMKPSYFYKNLNIPYSFIRTYFKCQGQTIMLQFEKKLWPVKMVCYPKHDVGQFSKGWILFARERNLKVGDVCVFELVNKEDPVLDVHIFRGP